MKSFTTSMLVLSVLALISAPAHAERQMKFTRQLELTKNDGFSDRAVATNFIYPSQSGRDYTCTITRDTKINEQPVIEAGREVLLVEERSQSENAEFTMMNLNKAGGVLAYVSCPRSHTLDFMKSLMGLEPLDNSTKRVPIRYEAAKPEVQEHEAQPQLIQPVYEQEEAAKSETSEL